MAKVMPVLGAAGFATDLTIKADEALANFYICQPSQSDMYRGRIASLGDIIARLGNNALELPKEIRRTLEAYLSNIFDAVDVTVTSTETATSIDLRISAILRDKDKSIDIQHVVSASDSKIRSIIDLQNNGRPIVLADA